MATKRAYPVLFVCVIVLGMVGCESTGRQTSQTELATYSVERVSQPMVIDGKWDNPVWQKVKPIQLANFMGDRPKHFPKTQAKLLYDDKNVYVIFKVDDQYVRAVARKHQDAVCHDSCVEFFFAPTGDIAKGYFNLEMNCGGTILLYFFITPRENQTKVAIADIESIEVAHSMPKNVKPEIADPTTWTVEYRLPVEFFTKYCPEAKKPAPGVVWRANFYKCGDDTSQPHWLTWSFVDKPEPDFHVPEYFGAIKFK